MSQTIQRLRAAGVEVEVLAPSYRGLSDQVVDGIRVHRFRYAPAPLETLTHDQTTPDRLRDRPAFLALVPSYLLSGTLAAIRLARSGRFDVVHAFWPLPHGLFGLAARRFAGVPLVSTFFGVELRWVRRQLPFLGPLLRRIIRRSDAVTVISSHTAEEVRRVAPEADVRAIPFGAAVEPADGSESWQPRREDEPFRILFVGRLVERKGVGVALHALARLNDGAYRLRVVGEGPEGRGLQELASKLGVANRVEFTGRVDDVQLRRELDACDLFVLPAIEDAKGDVEGLGVVLIEALLHRKPVVASRSGGIRDIVEDGRTGLLVEPGDADALAVAIRRLRDDPALSVELATAGKAFVEERFSWERIVGDLVELYEQVGGGRGAT